MPSIQARMLNKIFQKMPKDPPGVEHDFVAEREQNARRKPPKLPRNVSLEEMDFDGISGEILRPVLGEKERFEGNTDDLSEPVQLIWYIHGGGFTTGSARESRDLTQYLVSKYRVPCIATNYRLSPEHRWPAHLDDCMKVYQCLKDRGATPGKILLMARAPAVPWRCRCLCGSPWRRRTTSDGSGLFRLDRSDSEPSVTHEKY